MFVVSLNYKVPLTEIDRLQAAHIEWLKACYAEGIFVASGPKKPRTGGIIIAQCPRDVLDGFKSAFTYQNHIPGYHFGERFGDGQIDFERSQIAIVNPDDARSDRQRDVELLFRVHFHQCVQMIFGGLFRQMQQLLLIHCGDDQQNSVRSTDCGLCDLDFVDDKIFP